MVTITVCARGLRVGYPADKDRCGTRNEEGVF